MHATNPTYIYRRVSGLRRGRSSISSVIITNRRSGVAARIASTRGHSAHNAY